MTQNTSQFYQLGIDTGGTYTDAVFVDDQQQVVAKQKSLTTRFDLTVGIKNAIEGLPQALLSKVNLVALSTTLSTNSVVEERGAPICILLPGYGEREIEKSGLYNLLEKDYIVPLAGGHNAFGEQEQPLDLEAAKTAILQRQSKVSAFAISSMFAIRNPAHEQQIRELVVSLTNKPVACGHELASSLGAPRRAFTTALNARMILFIKDLIESVEQILQEKNIQAPLMIVKGDGSLINAKTALLQPVSTVLSGPAASVIGGCALSGRENAVVVDIGGTTTDIAIVTNGRPELCEDGAVIGDTQPMVEAIRVFSIGLGGDSEIRFKGKLYISQRRVVPMSLLAHQYPHVIPALHLQWSSSVNPRHNRFALPLQNNPELLASLNDEEKQVWDMLLQGPLEMDALVQQDRKYSRAVAKMERMGLVIYSGFTPSDATHVLGLSDHWSNEGAQLGAQLWARQMRNLYGCGNWELGDAIAPSQTVFDMVSHGISQKLIEAGLNQQGKLEEFQAQNLTQLLADIILRKGRAEKLNPLFDLRFAKDYPLVAVGGPSKDFFPEVARLLNMELILPEHGDIANAIGAVMGAVVQTVHVTVTQPEFGVFYVFHKGAPYRYESLPVALEKAEILAAEEAAQLAKQAGSENVEVKIIKQHNHVSHDIDGELFVSTQISAVATGRPNCLLQNEGL